MVKNSFSAGRESPRKQLFTLVQLMIRRTPRAAGFQSGTPKIRARQIIANFEDTTINGGK